MKLRFEVRPERYAITRLSPDSETPEWATRGDLYSITRTPDELSIICDERNTPLTLPGDRNWRCLGLKGPFTLTTVGIAANFTTILANAGVSVLVVSTFDTDYVLLKAESLEKAVGTLRRAGHVVTP